MEIYVRLGEFDFGIPKADGTRREMRECVLLDKNTKYLG
jgi:hypothetical protein